MSDNKLIRELEQPTRVDVVVIGSGPVGSAAAVRLAQQAPGASILVLEAGPWVTPTAGLNAKNLTDTDERSRVQLASQGPSPAPYGVSAMADRASQPVAKDRGDALARPGTFLFDALSPTGQRPVNQMPAAALSSNVGGMGVHWTCACPWPYGSERSQALDDDTWTEILDHARQVLHVTSDGFRTTRLGRQVLAGLSAEYAAAAQIDRAPQPMPLAVTVTGNDRDWTGPATIWDQLPAGASVKLRPETLATRLVVDGDRVTAVVARDLATGQEWQIDAEVVFVAADSFRTPQLLWASGIRPAALGRYLNDHIQLMSLVDVDVEQAPDGIEVDPVVADERPARGSDPVVGVYWIPFSDEHHPFHGQVMQFDLSPVPVEEDALSSTESREVVGLGYFLQKDIRTEDRVSFSDTEVDFYGLPQMSIHYGFSARDEDQIQRAQQYLRRSASAFGRLRSDPMVLEAGSSLHYQGTVRMGAVDDGTSVCDSTSRVWQLQNLYLGGNGVIASPTAGNPTLTSVGLALRAADAAAATLPARAGVTP